MSRIEPTRIQLLNPQPVRDGRYVLYWMQAAQRAEDNHALEYAIEQANALGQPLLAVFGLTADFPEANERHYRFMLEGLRETQAALARRGVPLVVLKGEPSQVALRAAREGSLLVTDRGYLRGQKQWRQHVADQAPCRVVQVETEVVVPVEVASGKEEFAARTIRPKIHLWWDEHLRPVPRLRLKCRATEADLPAWVARDVDLRDVDAVLRDLRVPGLPETGSGSRFTGGPRRAARLLDTFIANGLAAYDETGNEPAADATSHLSPYLHFGQISPLTIALAASGMHSTAAEPFLEQLIVRRELAMNFVHYNDRYDTYAALPDWARKTLEEHRIDRRPALYSLEEMEQARTGDEYWNAAMREMLHTGFMHNTMRMYWGKKIIEWSPAPEEACARMLQLNHKYFVDGRDPVSFANVLWCFGKHDRPFGERAVFGKVRYMNAAGLKRKYDMAAYVRRVAEATH
jgi:deoxyribodipyrimidine photo-lyase